jgi:proton-dependent oligopeptide transporter, POT family
MFQFLAYITPIFGGMVADAKWGRYKTICVFCGVYFLGLLIILLTSIPSALAHGGGLAGWTVGAIIVAIGTGGIKSNVSPLVADQYRKTRMFVKTLSSGERVIVDPNVTITRIYNLFYWCINVGSLSSIATTELEHRVGFWAAFILPTIVFLGTPIVLISARSTYYKVPPRGSVLIETYRVWKIALRGFWSHPIKYIQESRATGVWNRAKPSFVLGDASAKDKKEISDKNRWLTWGELARSRNTSRDGCADTLVQMMHLWMRSSVLLRRAKSSCSSLFVIVARPCYAGIDPHCLQQLYWISYNQITTNLVSMAADMSLHGVPNDLFQNFDPIALIILIPVSLLMSSRGT